MRQQSIVWTALPNGSNGPNAPGTTLRLSLMASPRLWNDDASVQTMPLSEFPDFLDWPAIIGAPGTTFDVSFNGAAPVSANVVATKPLRSDLWQGLFKNDTRVIPFRFQNLSGIEILSFPATEIEETIKLIVQTVATDPDYGGGIDLPPRDVLGDDTTLGEIARPIPPPKDYVPVPIDDAPVFVGSTEPEPEREPTPSKPIPQPDPEPTFEPVPPGCGCLPAGCAGCLAAPIELLRRFLKWLGLLAMLPFTMSAAGGGGGFSRKEVGTRKDAFDQLGRYIEPTSKVSQDMPSQPELQDSWDFHQMIATLGDYPNLLRYFGLVVDLEVTLPAALPANGTVSITPNLTLALTTFDHPLRTHYEIGNETFIAQPGPGSELRNGLLRVDDTNRFRVIQMDVAGGGTKYQNTATNVCGRRTHNSWDGTDPQEEGLPTLQTAGLSIVRPQHVAYLQARFLSSWALDAGIAAIDNSSPPDPSAPPAKTELFAEDVVRGYRVDVFDDKSTAWHSLCRRIGTYTFEDVPGPPLEEEDEGFVQPSATEPVPGAGPRVLRAHESLFTWNGWSLGAQRVGKTILPSDSPDPDSPTHVGDPSNAPLTQFRMEVAFRPRPRSLPRLRFGYEYRLRVRAVDLAGNSVFGPDDAAFTQTQAEVTPQVRYRRFEPVSPPMVMPQAEVIEGESLERLVVRSRFDDPDASIEAQRTARHIIPPKTSQLMAEHHRKFDGAPAMLSDDVAWTLAGREAGSFTHSIDPVTGDRVPIPGATEVGVPEQRYWIQTNDTFDVSYLPDPCARGVLLMGLPGMNLPDDIVEPGPQVVNKIPFQGVWPDPKPFRLRVSGVRAGAAAATPAWDAANRVLDVQLPQGETYTVRISSYFHETDLDNMAIWKWIADTGAPTLANLRATAIAGRNWLHLPFRTLVLVHAVQQPLVIPSFGSLASQKTLHDTIATLNGQFVVDAKSTSKVDTHAFWRDPFDDVSKPFDELTDFTEQEMDLAEYRLDDPADNEVDFTGIKHPVGDTKYHAVTYTPTASTRFREYFPPAITDIAANLIRPFGGEAGIPTTIDIFNSARPDDPKPLYIVPLFAWERTAEPAGPKSSRSCAGLRVYLSRPWFSTGAGELLGVTLRPPGVPVGSEQAEVLKKYTSEWGMDPLWPAAATFPLFTNNFLTPAVPPMTVRLAEVTMDVDVVGYAPKYDTVRNLWYCDILLDPGTAYFPMVRLALVRFHPKSVPQAHISNVVIADFMQLVPHRELTYDTSNLDTTGVLTIQATGPTYVYNRGTLDTSSMFVRLEQRSTLGGTDEIGWEPIVTMPLRVVVKDPAKTTWATTLTVPPPRPAPLRIVVLEAESFVRDAGGNDPDVLRVLEGSGLPGNIGITDNFEVPLGHRITFADAVEVP